MEISLEHTTSKGNTQQRFQVQEESCMLCQEKLETLVHVFVQCLVTEIIWANSRWSLRINRLNINSISQWVHLGIKVEDEHAFILFAIAVCDQI